MKMNVSEFARLTGVSVRTLHYYDEIGLLTPDFVDIQNGYRFYGEPALQKMQEILFYRELDFPLKAIKEILSSPDYNKQKVLSEQKQLLILKKKRLDRIIKQLESTEKGERIMDFNAFDNSEIDSYKQEVKDRWGETAAYKKHIEKTAAYTNEKWDEVGNSLEKIIEGFAAIKNVGEAPDSEKALTQVKVLQDYITQTQYTCTNEILYCLGQMYVADERFKRNIDKAGTGTAQFISDAINEYTKV